MSKLDPNQLSSNWKRLQATLNSEKKKKPSTAGSVKPETRQPEQRNGQVKRKSKPEAVNGIKRRIVETPGAHSKRRKMGYSISRPANEQHTTNAVNGTSDGSKANLIREHGIPSEDVNTAYNSSTPQQQHDDDVHFNNAGHHPTNKPGRYVALDCEMVGTGPPPDHKDHLLARASLVNFHGDLLYDSYVLPPAGEHVHDYRTYVSGIKPTHLRPGYARPFTQVQKDVAQLLDGRVLVGHALRNDLRVLLLGHPARDVRDTSRYAKFRVASRGRAPALRNLARQELGLEIQTGEHSSIEDARAAMRLFRKEKKGFEEDNRRQFGQPRKPMGKAAASRSAGGRGENELTKEDESGSIEDDEEDLALLEEDDSDVGGEEGVLSMDSTPTAKKKRKKKKRTKRK